MASSREIAGYVQLNAPHFTLPLKQVGEYTSSEVKSTSWFNVQSCEKKRGMRFSDPGDLPFFFPTLFSEAVLMKCCVDRCMYLHYRSILAVQKVVGFLCIVPFKGKWVSFNPVNELGYEHQQMWSILVHLLSKKMWGEKKNTQSDNIPFFMGIFLVHEFPVII